MKVIEIRLNYNRQSVIQQNGHHLLTGKQSNAEPKTR